MEEFLQRSDIVKMHLALDDSTLNILSEERLRLMKQTAVLINIVRGGLIGETVLNKLL
ncbi:MAG TPA: phosphoglycerate dehydrogenase, partial [Sulfurimonas sp.]|nr:phosphoglycerate dehydrogenase [Sulfurimonas sp.]